MNPIRYDDVTKWRYFKEKESRSDFRQVLFLAAKGFVINSLKA